MADDNPYQTSPTGLGRDTPMFGPPPWPEQGGIPFEGTLTYEDFLHAQRLHAGMRGGYVLPAIVVTIASLLIGLMAWDRPRLTPATLLAFSVPLVVLALLVVRRYSYRQMWTASKLNGQPMMGHISDVGVELRLPILEARMTWPAYLKYKADDELLLIYQQPAMFNLFPRRFFRDDADWQASRELLEQHLAE